MGPRGERSWPRETVLFAFLRLQPGGRAEETERLENPEPRGCRASPIVASYQAVATGKIAGGAVAVGAVAGLMPGGWHTVGIFNSGHHLV